MPNATKEKTEYALIEDDMAQLHKKAQWDHVGVEINGPGSVLIEHLKIKGLPVKPITTSGKITDLKKLRDYSKMSKPALAKWMLMAKQQHRIKYPEKITNPFIKELIKQNEHFKEHITDSGAVQYFAEGRAHDDLTMALMIACRLAQRYINLGGGGHVLGPITNDTEDEDLMLIAQ